MAKDELCNYNGVTFTIEALKETHTKLSNKMELRYPRATFKLIEGKSQKPLVTKVEVPESHDLSRMGTTKEGVSLAGTEVYLTDAQEYLNKL